MFFTPKLSINILLYRAIKMKYNKFEKHIAKILDRYPYIRQISKFIYQRLFYMVYYKKYFRYELHPKASLQGILQKDNSQLEVFFGYYDKSPWSYDGKYYLVHVFDKQYKNKVKIGVYDCECGSLNIIDETPAFNFQQGAMLGWLDQNSYNVIYNTVKNGNLIAKIKNAISKSEIKTIPIPIQTINYEGTEALTLNYKRLYKIRPEYGYNVSVENFSSDVSYEEDGIWRINLNTEQSKLIISLAELITLNHNKFMDKSQHKINHIMYSPSGKRFVFMHRWIGYYGKFSRLYTMNNDDTDIYCLADDRMVSHYCWVDDEYLIAYARKEPIGDKYFLLKDKTEQFKIIGDNILDVYGDGHPHIAPNKEWVVMDTYPNKGRIRELVLFNLKTEKKEVIGRFFAPWKYDGYYRCDLHPRWNPDGTKISIDSVHEGFRNSYIIDVSRIVKNE